MHAVTYTLFLHVQLGSVGVPEADSMRVMFPDPGDAEPPVFQALTGQDSADVQVIPIHSLCSVLRNMFCLVPISQGLAFVLAIAFFGCHLCHHSHSANHL